MKNYQITIESEENKPVYFVLLPFGTLFYFQSDPKKNVYLKCPGDWLIDFNTMLLIDKHMVIDNNTKFFCYVVNSLTIKS